jgi:DNA mismatch repair protein MSH6
MKKTKLETTMHSDALEVPSSQENKVPSDLPSPSAALIRSKPSAAQLEIIGSSPSRKARRVVTYAESSDDEAPFAYGASNSQRRRGKARAVVKDEDDFEVDEDDIAEDDGTL